MKTKLNKALAWNIKQIPNLSLDWKLSLMKTSQGLYVLYLDENE